MAFVAANAWVFIINWAIVQTKLLTNINPAVLMTISGALIYLLTLVFVWAGSEWAKKRTNKLAILCSNKINLGLGGWLTWQQLLLGVAAFVVAMVMSTIVLGLVSQIFPGVNLEQAQDIGLTADMINNRFELGLVFLLLVIVAPMAEELLFRGYIYGRLRSITSVATSTIITSVLFGLAHGQLNVGVVTFVLSIVMCLVREASESIHPAFVIHILKNGIAFALLFGVR